MQGALTKEAGADSRSAPGQETTRKDRRSSVPREPKRLTDEQAELAGEHWDWAMRIARKYASRFKQFSFDLDFESAAAVGLCEAASLYSSGRGVKFTTYAYSRVFGACVDIARTEELRGYGRGRHGEAPKVRSLNQPVHIGGNVGIFMGVISVQNAPTFQSLIESGDLPIGWELRSIEATEAISRPLDWTTREVVILTYCYGFTLAKIGRILCLSESRVSQIHSCALAFLRTAIRPEALSS